MSTVFINLLFYQSDALSLFTLQIRTNVNLNVGQLDANNGCLGQIIASVFSTDFGKIPFNFLKLIECNSQEQIKTIHLN